MCAFLTTGVGTCTARGCCCGGLTADTSSSDHGLRDQMDKQWVLIESMDTRGDVRGEGVHPGGELPVGLIGPVDAQGVVRPRQQREHLEQHGHLALGTCSKSTHKAPLRDILPPRKEMSVPSNASVTLPRFGFLFRHHMIVKAVLS